MDFKKTSQQIRALDTPEKLKIVALLAEEGRKSISDVARDLKIHFSTTHKYLEQLENAGLVHSKTVKEDRLKRYFYVKDFELNISPSTLTATEHSEKEPETFRVITDDGKEGAFNKKIFTHPYAKAGVPRAIIDAGVNHLTRHAYDYITILELRNRFRQFMHEKTDLIASSMSHISQRDIQKRTYTGLLNYVNPQLMEKHISGDIFIQNLWHPQLFNFVHDVRGIYQHGVNGIAPTNFKELLAQITESFDAVSELGVTIHCIDSINYHLAPFWNGDIASLKKFFESLKTKTYIGIDYGVPKFAEHVSTVFWTNRSQKAPSYAEYADTALTIAETIKNVLKTSSTANIIPVYKLWSEDHWKHIPEKNCYVANMFNNWQGLNASYVGGVSRFDSNWRGWMTSIRVGEVENITINLPRLASNASSINDFFESLKSLCSDLIRAYGDIAELTNGVFFKNELVWKKSAQTGHWKHVSIRDSQYAISLAGLSDAVKSLKTAKPEEELCELIVKTAAEIIQKNKTPIRIVLKEEHRKLILNRFAHLDKKNQPYSPGVRCSDIKISASLHKYLNGGHCIKATKTELLKMNDFGLARI